MTLEDLEKLRTYVAKDKSYDFKTPIKCIVEKQEIIKESKTKKNDTKTPSKVNNKKKLNGIVERVVISFDKTKKDNYLLFLIDIDGDKRYYGESMVSFI